MAAILVGAATFASCGGDTAPSTPASLLGVSGQTIAGRAGDAVPVSVRVTAANGRALSGQIVTFSVAGGGSTAPTSAPTDASGTAQTSWTLGPSTGVQTLNASVPTLTPFTVLASVAAGRPVTLSIVAGGDQRATVGTAVPTPPVVRVLDVGGNPVPGVRLAFTGASAGGRVTGESATTGVDGTATVGAWQLGTVAGPDTLHVRVVDAGASPALGVAIVALALPGRPVRVAAQAPATVAGTAGATLSEADRPAIVVTDSNHNRVPGVLVTFRLAGAGSVGDRVEITDANGRAMATTFTLGTRAGAGSLTATAGEAGRIAFTILVRPDLPARVEIMAGDGQETRAGTALPIAPAVRVVDRYGNPVPEITVTFVAADGTTRVTGATQTTNADGLAVVGGVTLGIAPGTYAIEARVAGLPSAVFRASTVAGNPATVARIGGDSVLSATAYQRSAPLTVVVRDAQGQPVRGASVGFTLSPPSLGTLSAVTVATDAQGQAAVSVHAGPLPGSGSVRVSVGGGPSFAHPVTVVPNRAHSVREVQGNGQSAVGGSPVALVPTVEVRDAFGNPVAGVPVRFLTFPSSFVRHEVDTTDAQGRADPGMWVLAGTQNRVDATVLVGSVLGNPVAFTAPGLPQTGPYRLSSGAGHNQWTNRSTSVPVVPSVVVTMPDGTRIAGASVRFSASGDGVLFPEVVQTGADGVARVQFWRLSSRTGGNTLQATLSGTTSTVVIWAYGY